MLLKCSETQIPQQMAESTCPFVYVCCELTAPICFNSSSSFPETTNNTEDADGMLLLSGEKNSGVLCAVVFEKQREERNKGKACR
jgi:hypothetical protein